MKKMIPFMRNEVEVEMTTGAFALSMIIIYGFQSLFIKVYDIKFLYIVEMFCISYLINWLQKLLFIPNKVFDQKQYRIRKLLWFALPIVICSIAIFSFGWYQSFPAYSSFLMIGFIIFYHIIMWLCLQKLYQSETIQLNQMLHIFQKKASKQ